MPAETHRQRDAVDLVGDVIDLFDVLLDEPMGVGGIRAETDLADLGVDDLAVLHLWDAAVEELAERASAEPDVEELLLARTVGDLAQIIVHSIATASSQTCAQPFDPMTPSRNGDR